MSSEENTVKPNVIFIPIDFTGHPSVEEIVNKWHSEHLQLLTDAMTEDIECEIVDPLQLPSSEEIKTHSPNSI